MKVEIWSDVRCPFCYIGKRKFESALEQFPHKGEIEIVWRAFELDPTLQTDASLNALEYLARRKGIAVSQARQMTQSVADAAREVGLELDSGKTVVANTFNAHRLIHLAQAHGLGSQAQEKLFHAFFVDGQNIDDASTLIAIGDAIGLERGEVETLLASDAYADAVRQDERQAQTLGIGGVPFFVFDSKYAVSGAQSPAVLLQALERSWSETEKQR